MFRLSHNTLGNYMVGFMKRFQKQTDQTAPVDPLVSKFSHINPDNPKRVVLKTGRPWHAQELRLKSNEDLHKLYYVCLKEKNIILSDQVWRRKLEGRKGDINATRKLKVTVARILTVLSEREKVRKEYRENLEREYIQKKRQQLVEATKDLNDPDIPKVTWRLMKEKQRDLRKGIDNTDYIQRQWNFDEAKKTAKAKMEDNVEKMPPKFSSFFEQQLLSDNYNPSQQEILRSQIRNWRMLSMRQRRIVLGHLNARRARDARSQFLKELRTLGQKLNREMEAKSH